MEVRGYIVRRQLPTNKKNVYVYLSDEGRAMRARLVPLAEETNSVSTEGISADAIKTTRRVLLAMIENLAKEELDYGTVPAISTSSKKHAAHGTARGKASPGKASRSKALGTNP